MTAMSTPHSLRFRLGLFVLVALILLAALATMFGGFPDLFRKYNAYTVRFTDASGVGVGTPVRLSGVRIGEVKKVELDNATGKVIVHIAVEKRYTIYPDDVPMLVASVLGGDTTIDFVRQPRDASPPPELVPPPDVVPDAPVPAVDRPPPDPPPVNGGEEESQAKQEERQPAKPGTQFEGVKQPDVANILKAMATLVEPTQESLRLIRQSLQRLEKTAPLAEDTMREYRELARDTRRTLPELRRTNDELNVAARNWGRLGERLDVLVQTNQDKVVKAVDNLNDALVRVINVLSDENQKNLAATLKNARAGTENLESIARNAEELMKEGRATVKRLNESLVKADEVLVNLNQATKPLAERSDRITKNLDESAVKLNQTLNDVRELMKVFNQGDGTLQKLLSDPALYNHADDILCALRAMMPRVDRALRDLEVFADKIARHPESLGVGGAVRPSAGLKESPTAPSPSLLPRR
jgi:ABC-type transporter Mla subunit MlaD